MLLGYSDFSSRFNFMFRILALILILGLLAAGFGCSKDAVGGGGSSPTEAYKLLYSSVKAKNIDAVKQNLTTKTLELGAMQAARTGAPVESVYENGFTETTFASSLPTIRDERINGNMGAIEVWNAKKSSWEDLPFMIENGYWKLAVGDIFAGTYRSPGRGRDEREKEAANVMSPQIQTSANANANRPGPPIRDVPIPVSNSKK